MGHNIVLDVNSGTIHTVDDLTYDVLGLYLEYKEKEIVEILKDKYEIDLSLAGNGSGEEKEKILKMANENKVRYLGNLSQKNLGEVFRKSHVFVLPSFYEGLGLVTIEALACGLRAVVTNHSGIKEYLGEERDYLLNYKCIFSKDQLHLPGPDFVRQDIIYYR